MGYRSEVGIKCEDKAFELFKAAWEKVNFTPDKILHKESSKEFIFTWSWVKWYEEYKDVKAIIEVMDKLDGLDADDTSNKGMGYKMIRLGEDESDIEIRKNGFDVEFYHIRTFDIEGFTECA